MDALSRNPVGVIEINHIGVTEMDWILAARSQDEDISRICKILRENVRNSETKQYFVQYELRNNKLYRKLERKVCVGCTENGKNADLSLMS